ncbi:hypothetical protein HPB50_016087 [Hyalomma asiaticum]|uniref:Uncharacterized protein n=1 Tax=Hyalomma asiaticum TaxID=266040 RepID=A0ACB7TIL3_HYAAI|nr:hypothetical protein HPB50_016087 [Hyalomma asiaticum]
MNTAGAFARRRGRACGRRARRCRRRASPVITRLSLERQLGLPPPVEVSASDLFDSVPRIPQSSSGVSTQLTGVHVAQESSTALTTALGLEAQPESEQAAHDGRSGQQPCAPADRDPRPASDSRMATPPPPNVAQDTLAQEPAAPFVSPDRRISLPARSEVPPLQAPRGSGAYNVLPVPPQEVEHAEQQEQAVQQEETRQLEQRYAFVGRDAGRHRDPNWSVHSSTVVSHPLPNVASCSTNKVTTANDGIVVDVPYPHCPSNVIADCGPPASATTAIRVPSEPLQHAAPPAANAPLDWTADDVAEWVRMIPLCAPYADRFREEGIDGRSLVLMDIDFMRVLFALPLATVVKIFEGLRELHESRHQ